MIKGLIIEIGYNAYVFRAGMVRQGKGFPRPFSDSHFS